MSGLPYDLFDRGSILGAHKDDGLRILPPQTSLVLSTLSGGSRSGSTVAAHAERI
jgi:hypothetical protein